MITEIQTLLDEYYHWLKDNTSLREIDQNWVEITTPYLDRHNDYLQIYTKRENGGYLLTDDGYILDDLQTSGCKLDSPKRKQLLETALNGYGVQLKNEALMIHASANNFSFRKHNLVQAMLAVNDMFYMSPVNVANLFLESVTLWLNKNEIRFTENIQFTGKSGYSRSFNFIIPKSKKAPERIVQAVNHPDRQSINNFLLAWMDTKETRSTSSVAYVILNDSEREPSSSVIDALRNYEINPIRWNRKEEFIDALAA